ncbi:hypothetical protein [Streptomyces decoyicus]
MRERTTGGALPGMPFNTAAAEARASITTVLGSWAGLVVAVHRVTPPARTVDALAAFLVRHIGWLTAHSAAGSASVEVAQLVRAARRAVESARYRLVTVGSCPEPDCSGKLTALIRTESPDRPTAIRCRHNAAHEWAGHEWMRLRQRMRGVGSVGPSTVWLTAADICRMWGIPTGSVYRLASEQDWRRRSRDGRTSYHEADVLRVLQHRGSRHAT